MMKVIEVVETIISYADIGTDEPDINPLLPMETFYLAVLLIIFYYKLFVTIGCALFEWIYSSELHNQLAKLALDDEPCRLEIQPRGKKFSKKWNSVS